MLAVNSCDRNNHPECDYITIAIDAHTAFLHADTDQELFAEPPEACQNCAKAIKLDKSLHGYRKAPKLWQQHVVSLLESLNNHPLLTDPSCFRDEELNVHVFIHVDDGLLFGPSIEIL